MWDDAWQLYLLNYENNEEAKYLSHFSVDALKIKQNVGEQRRHLLNMQLNLYIFAAKTVNNYFKCKFKRRYMRRSKY